MEIGLGHKGGVMTYLRLRKEDEDIAVSLGKILESGILSKDEISRLLLFIRERIWRAGDKYL